MSGIMFGAISAGVAVAGFLLVLLSMFRTMVDQNATMRTTLKFVSERVERMETKIDAIRTSQRRG
jgi:hypothetical protein